jgi:nucleoside-diphosphate-sugar epimerase
MSRQAIITGAMGFIGHQLWRVLSAKDWRVTAIDDLRFVDPILQRARHEHAFMGLWNRAQADDVDLIDRFINSNDPVLFHLASHPNQAAVARDPDNACDNIVGVTSRLAEYCKREKIRIVYVSSSMVYGNWLDGKAIEEHPCDPVNAYGLYKKQAEEIVRMTLPGNHVIVRPSAVYGPRDSSSRVIMRWLNAALRGEPLHVDDPNAVLDFTFSEDVAKGLMLVGSSEITDTYNMTANRGYTLLEAANIVKQVADSSSEIVLGKGLSKDQPRRGTLDNSRLASYFRWYPSTSLHTGLSFTLEQMRHGHKVL